MRVLIAILAGILILGALRRQVMSRSSLNPLTLKIKNRAVRALMSLTGASVKMYFRNRTAVFFTLFIPVIFILIFGVLNFGGGGSIGIDVTNHSQSPLANQFVSQVKKIQAFKVKVVSEQAARDELGKGKADLQLIIPSSFGAVTQAQAKSSNTIQAYYNEARAQTGQTAGLILSQIANQMNAVITQAPQVIALKTTGVKVRNLTYIDFLIPGIVAMSIMQLGIISIAFAFVSFKSTGQLRRLQATPIHPSYFLFGESIARLIIGMLQVVVLVGLGLAIFHLHLIGSLWNLLVLALIGTATFLAMGFMVAGRARDENQAAPIANLIAFPQMFLSGVFFPRDSLPHWLHTITNYLPLTYLSDAMHRVSNEGVNLWAVRSDVLGLAVWGVISFFIAARLFTWE